MLSREKIKAFFETRELLLFHPESPGIRQRIIRNWWQRILRARNFATLSESIRATEGKYKDSN